MTKADHPAPLRELLSTIPAGKVLDIASGVGQFTRMLVDCLGSFDRIIGIDSSAPTIEKARSLFPEDSVTFEVADASALPFPDDSFDTVALANSLHHMEDLETVRSEIRRVLSPSGRWIVFEMHADAPSSASQNAIDLHLWAAAVDRTLGRYHAPVYSLKELTQIIAGLGLTNTRTVTWHSTDAPEDREGIVEVIHTILKQVTRMPQEPELASQAKDLIERIRRDGFQSQPFVLTVGHVGSLG
jgi:ubiquinone/menaquinone biosynthesis C-methylase UbiE